MFRFEIGVTYGYLLSTYGFKIFDSLGYPRRRNGLHARGRALVRHNGDARPPQRGVRVVGAATAKRVVGLSQQLQHQLVGAQAQAQQQGVVAIVRGGVVGFFQQEGGSQLHGFVAPGGGVHVAGGRSFFLFVEAGHSGGGVHQAISAAKQVGIECGGWGGHSRGGESRRGGGSSIGHAGGGQVSSFGSSRSS